MYAAELETLEAKSLEEFHAELYAEFVAARSRREARLLESAGSGIQNAEEFRVEARRIRDYEFADWLENNFMFL